MEIVGVIRDLGVPIGMLIWFMWRMERRLDKLDASLQELSKALKGDS